MRIVITTTQTMAGVIEKQTQTINISPFDTTPKALIEDKGDLLAGTGPGVLDNLPVGTDGQVLIADSGEATGLRWGLPSSSGAISLYNNDATDHDLGTVVIIDPTEDYGVIKTATAGDPKVFAVAIEEVASESSGLYAQSGQLEVLVQGNVSRGMWLVCSTTSGRAAAAGYIKPTSGGIGIALTGYAGGGAGSVYALVDVDLNSTAPLQQLATVSTNTGTGTTTTSHVADTGTDLLVARIVHLSASALTSVTYNGSSLTLLDSQVTGSAMTEIYYIKSPSIGTYNLVVTPATSVEVYVIITNYAGSQASPFRTTSKTTWSATTSVSVSPTSSVGDIVIDACRNTVSGWTVTGSGQTTEGTRGSGNYQHTSKNAGGAGTTTMSWAGASSSGGVVAVAIAGS